MMSLNPALVKLKPLSSCEAVCLKFDYPPLYMGNFNINVADMYIYLHIYTYILFIFPKKATIADTLTDFLLYNATK